MSENPLASIPQDVQTAIVSRAPEIDTQIATAKSYRRSIEDVLNEVKTQATMDDDTAAAMSYSLPRAGKKIDGPSVRLAEIFASAWGNLRAETRVTGSDSKFVYAEARVWDLEKNVAISCEVRRRITKKNGTRYDDDMIGVTGMAASSIALRNAIFRVIPQTYVKQAQEHARQVAIGNVKNLVETRTAAFGYFHRYGIVDEQILDALDKPSIEDVDASDIVTLKGMAQSIKEGVEVTTLFPPIKSAAEKASDERLKDKMRGKANPGTTVTTVKTVTPAPAPEPTPEPEPEPDPDADPFAKAPAADADPAQSSLIPEDAPQDADSEMIRKADAIDLYYSLLDQTEERAKNVTRMPIADIEAEITRLKAIV